MNGTEPIITWAVSLWNHSQPVFIKDHNPSDAQPHGANRLEQKQITVPSITAQVQTLRHGCHETAPNHLNQQQPVLWLFWLLKVRTWPWFWEKNRCHLNLQPTFKCLMKIYFCAVMRDYVTDSDLLLTCTHTQETGLLTVRWLIFRVLAGCVSVGRTTPLKRLSQAFIPHIFIVSVLLGFWKSLFL